jgi:glycosyltransferase involved in cell wall biosynthesis
MNMLEWLKSLDQNLISIVMPTLNRPRFLEATLFSIAESVDAPPYEVIVVDDGSDIILSKMNHEICCTYRKLYSIPITYIRLSKNTGTVSIPRNIGISHINGRIICPADDDCLFDKNKLRILDGAIHSTDSAQIAFGDRTACYKDGDKLVGHHTVIMSNRFDTRCVGIDNGQFIYKADVYSDITPVLAINACDWELYKQINPSRFVYADYSVCTYIWHTTNISRTPKEKRVNPTNVIREYSDYFRPNQYTDKLFSSLN